MGDFTKTRAGKLIERPPNSLPICQRGNVSKCPKGTPEKQNVLSLRNERFYRYYRQREAIGQHPDDEWYAFLASIVKHVEQLSIQEQDRRRNDLLLRSLIAVLGG